MDKPNFFWLHPKVPLTKVHSLDILNPNLPPTKCPLDVNHGNIKSFDGPLPRIKSWDRQHDLRTNLLHSWQRMYTDIHRKLPAVHQTWITAGPPALLPAVFWREDCRTIVWQKNGQRLTWTLEEDLKKVEVTDDHVAVFFSKIVKFENCLAFFSLQLCL